MDTFLVKLSSEVGVALKQNISTILVISIFSTAAYNALETVFITFDIIKNHRALYFWSMQVASSGTLVHTLSAIICCAFQTSTLPTSVFLIVGWYAMVTGQAVVLYSRLRLVILDTCKVRWVLWMIVVNAFILYVPMTVLFFGRLGGDALFTRPAAIYNRIQLVGFCAQESVICGIYLYEVMQNLTFIARIRGRGSRYVTTHLLCVSGLVFVLNILLLLTEYKLQFFQVGLQTMIYSIKLKAEFALLYNLRATMHSDPLMLPLGRLQGHWLLNNTKFLNMETSSTLAALEVVRPSSADPAGGGGRCHSLSSGTLEYHATLREISHRPEGTWGTRVLKISFSLAYLSGLP